MVVSKRVAEKTFENKYEKVTPLRKTKNSNDPAKRGMEQVKTEQETLDFHPRPERAMPAQWLITIPFFGTRAVDLPRTVSMPSSHYDALHR